MATIELSRTVDAPIERVFDLARSVDCHVATMGHGERAVAGVTEGLLAAGDEVTWRARHFGVPLRLRVRVTEVDRPSYFRDEQVAGPFADFDHEHRFEPVDGGTELRDTVRFRSPAGPLGAVADALVIRRYLRRLIGRRNRRLATLAAGDDWHRFLER